MNISMIGFQTWLESAANYERQKKTNQFSLRTISLLANELNNPQNAFKSFHIAGSKGKGSVSAMIASILHEAGFNEGLYTSPHIIDFLERVGKADGRFDNSIYEQAAGELIPFIDETSEKLEKLGFEQASWFELMTLFAFLSFRNAKVDYGVFETGLGGRFDATNILTPLVSIITPIELEHTEYLGNTIAKIAFEKAGIIKPHTPVCISLQPNAAKRVFLFQSIKKHSPVYFLDKALKNSSYEYNSQTNSMRIMLDFGGFRLNKGRETLFKRPLTTNLKLLGKVQVQNAALAALAVKTALPQTDETVIERGLSNTNLYGRFEISDYLYKKIYILKLILDGAHTENSVRITIDTLNHIFPNTRCNVLFAAAFDKKIENIAPLFFDKNNNFHRFFLTIPGEKKQSDFEKLTQVFLPFCEKNGKPHLETTDYSSIINKAIDVSAEENAILLVTGSFYLVSEVKKSLKLNTNLSPVEG